MQLLGRCYEITNKNLSGWYPLDVFINNGTPSLQALVDGGHGLLATGPFDLMEAYKQVLEQYLIKASLVALDGYAFVDGVGIPESPNSLIAAVFGRSYVVALSVKATYR